jgi:hypothetical protein
MIKMINQKVRREKIKYPYRKNQNMPIRERNRMKEEKEDQKKLLCPKAGTATSFPAYRTASPTDMNIVNKILWIKRNT